MTLAPATRTLRADAARNRQLVLDAAARTFGDRGTSATLNDVARAAGVGVGTVYRNFPDKEALLDALFDDKIAALVNLAQRASEVEDPAEAIRDLLLGIMEKRATDRGLDAILTAPGRGTRFARELDITFVPTVDRLVARAITAGQLRPDFSGQEVCLLGFMVGTLADITRESDPQLWRRYAQLLIDGTRPAAATEPLSPAPLSFADAATALGRAS